MEKKLPPEELPDNPDIPTTLDDSVYRTPTGRSPYQTGELPGWAPRFFEILRQTGNVRLAAKAAGVAHATAYNYYQGVPAFKKGWDACINEARDLLLQEAWDRALNRSDRMLAMLLRAYWPELFGPRVSPWTPVNQQNNQTLIFNGVDTDAIRRRLESRFLPDPGEEPEAGDFSESE